MKVKWITVWMTQTPAKKVTTVSFSFTTGALDINRSVLRLNDRPQFNPNGLKGL